MEKLLKVLTFCSTNKLVTENILQNFEVSGQKCLKFWVSEFLSLLDLLPLRKKCTSTTGFRNIGVKCWVLVLKTLRVARYLQPSVLLSSLSSTFYMGLEIGTGFFAIHRFEM